ncbi:MAG: hypothetical protein ACRDGL_10060 [Candidatus Limnocylindrales bacterium]
MAWPSPVQPVQPGAAAPGTAAPGTVVQRAAAAPRKAAAEDPRAQLWRDASVALVLIAGLALAGSAGLLPDLLGSRSSGGPARSGVPLSSPSVGSGPTIPGASPSLPFTGQSTPTPSPSATPGQLPSPTGSPAPRPDASATSVP